MMDGEKAYFRNLSEALLDAGYYKPTLVIDLDRLDANIAAVKAAIPPGLTIRVVDKSLPSVPLLKHIMDALETRRIMSFHLPVTNAVLEAFPDTNILFGKPMPVAALKQALQTPAEQRARHVANITWLVDTPQRLKQYSELATSESVDLKFAFEVDCGMHRGGFATPKALQEATDSLQSTPNLLCMGIMGYEAHIPEMPGFLGGAPRETATVQRRLSAFCEVLPPDMRRIINTGGSKTSITYDAFGAANEVSMGSGFLKPTDFDVEALSKLVPAAFISTPVLKVLQPRLPGPAFITKLMQLFGTFPRHGCFIYGGKWYAEPAWPPSMTVNSLWGESSNQQLMALPSASAVSIDDLVFFRPTQSEAVLQQFGAIVVFSKGKILQSWSTIPAG